MAKLLVDQRDQKFVLHEMLGIEELFSTNRFGHLSRGMVDASLNAAHQLALKEFYPIMMEADRDGCRLENGSVRVPRCYHRLKEHFEDGGWPSLYTQREFGGQGFPLTLWASLYESFMHNCGFIWIWSTPFSATHLIEKFGTDDQKARYLTKLASGKWGSALAIHEDACGSDAGMQTCVAVRQPDGSFRIKGVKNPVTCGDSDLFENLVHLVCARIEGDPENETGLSMFLVPKFPVQADGSLGARNDFLPIGVEQKLGVRANPTCEVAYGQNGGCWAELLGAERQGMAMTFQVLNLGEVVEGAMATGVASTAYLHALDHARKRIQGPHISQAQDPDAPKVPILAHPDVRRMLLWMKSQVEGMRALLYFCSLCQDKAQALTDPEEKEKWAGFADLLQPIFRIYAADTGIDVVREAMKVHGRYGFFSDLPIQQLYRDIPQPNIGGVTVGISALLFVARALGRREGKDFTNLLGQMVATVETYKDIPGIGDLAPDVQRRIGLLGETGGYFAACAQGGNPLMPICNATPFTHLMGAVCIGWLLYQQAGIAAGSLAAMLKREGIDPGDEAQRSRFLSQNAEAAFYDGKLSGARYFIKNVLPRVDGLAAAIRSEDLSIMAINDKSF
jgi:alkylation response protein AidB-like acyl-CoA dehydrogenase